MVKVIYFNDLKIPHVKPRFKHDNHFHVTIYESGCDMKRFALLATLVAAFAALAHGAQQWEWFTRPAEVKYAIYGGDLGDTYAPVPKDVHVAFYVRGRAAKEMFDAMGPDKTSECGIEKGGRVRKKEHVACRYRPSDGYQCDFGFDLTSGKSIGGSIC